MKNPRKRAHRNPLPPRDKARTAALRVHDHLCWVQMKIPAGAGRRKSFDLVMPEITLSIVKTTVTIVPDTIISSGISWALPPLLVRGFFVFKLRISPSDKKFYADCLPLATFLLTQMFTFVIIHTRQVTPQKTPFPAILWWPQWTLMCLSSRRRSSGFRGSPGGTTDKR